MPDITVTYDEDEVRALIAADIERRFGHIAKPHDVHKGPSENAPWSITIGIMLSRNRREKPKLGAKLLAVRKRVFGKRQSPMAYDADTIPRPHYFYLSDLLGSEAWKGSN